MNPVGVLFDLLLIPCLIIMAVALLTGGGIGTVTMRGSGKKDARIRSAIILVLGIALSLCISSAFIPKEFWLNNRPTYHQGDREMEPYMHAIDSIDRQSIGFTPLSKEAGIKILVNESSGYVSCPDVELYIPDLPFKRQHICLEKHGSKYDWYSEYEVYLGPEDWDTLWLAYSSVPTVMGMSDKSFQLVIEYRGPEDTRLPDGAQTLADVQLIAAEWRAYHLSHP